MMTHRRKKNCLNIVFLLALYCGVATPVAAQDITGDVPPLQPFSNDIVAQGEGVFVKSTTGQATQNGMPSVQDDPCPQPRSAYENTPDDLKAIQEDITRFNLCIQRAQLLDRLNTLALESAKAMNTALGNNIVTTPKMPVISVPALPESSVISPDDTMNEPTPSRSTSAWRIQDINGMNSRLSATLVNSRGTSIDVHEGSTMPDNKTTVAKISTNGVTLHQNGKDVPLKWE